MKPKTKAKMKNLDAAGVSKAKLSKKDIADMSIEDMFSAVQDDDVDVSDGELPESRKPKNKARKKKKKLKKTDDKLEDEEEFDFEEDEELAGVGKLSQKEYLEQLKKKDPQFYATMMQSADVLDLQSSEDEEEEDSEKGGAIFTPPEKLEVDSDESDLEEDGLRTRGSNVITLSLINQWEQQLSSSQPLNTFLEVNQALLAAIESLGRRDKEEDEASSKYKVEGPQIFNAIIRICLRKIPSTLEKILNIKSPKEDPAKTKKWSKYKGFIKSYLRHMVMLTECIAEASAAEMILKRGLLPLLPYYATHIPTCKLLVKRLVTMWATNEKRVRVIAFICIFRLSRSLQGQFLEWVLKRLYFAYVQNSRFTSPSTWGLIDFMRISLVELYNLNQSIAYKHAFVYIRQMAFHLRNAIMVKKKERVQLVYNWQYIHCIHLWADLVAKTHPSPALSPIIYPLTQIAIGTMKLQPSPSFYPLVFQVCGILTEISRHTGTFIPVLPFMLEILKNAPLDKKHKKASIKPFDWLCMLRLSRAEMTESAFKDGVVDQVYHGIMSYLSVESASIAFPELVVSLILQLKSFLKNCKVPNYTKKIKQLLEKIQENKNFIESKRREVSFNIADTKAVQDWEIAIKQSGTPLGKHYENWKKVWEKDQLRRISNRVEMDDYNLPTVKKRELMEKQKAKDKDEFKELFASDDDDDDDDDDETRFLIKSERNKQSRNKEPTEKEKAEVSSDDVDDSDEEEESEMIKPPHKKRKVGSDFDLEEIQDSEEAEEKESILDEAEDEVREMELSD